MAEAAAAVAPQPVSAQVVGNAFVQQYYHILHHSPALVHRFYQDVSKLGRPEDDGTLSVTTTMIAINEKILSLNYGDFRAEIKSVDAQESFNGGVQVLVTGYLTGIDNMIRNFSQCFFLAPQDRGYFVLNDMFRYIESSNQPDEKQVLVDDVVDPVTQEQSPVPPAVQENHASDESNHVDEVTEGEVFNPPEKGDVPTVEEEVKVPEVVDEVQDDSQPVVESDRKVEEVQKKSYASIEKTVPFSSPAPAPKKSPQKSQEQQSIPPPASETDGQIPSSGASDNGNIQEGEAGYSIYIKGLPMTATVSMLENAFKKFGQIRSGGIQVRSNKQQGFCFGFVGFEVPIAVEKALEIALCGMGALIDDHFRVEFEDECGLDLGFEKEPEILAIENAVKVLLQGLGEDVNREGIWKTPLRVAKALREGTKGYGMKAQDIVHGALFPEAGLENGVGHAGGMGGLVIVRDLDFFSYCEACLLPFQVKCHVGYIPCGQVVVGLSKLSRVVGTFAKRLQDPHRLADEVCKSLHDGIKPAGVAVVLQCFHIHSPKISSTFLDVNDHGWTKTLITSGSGLFEDKKADDWSDFLSLLKFKTKNLANDAGLNGSLDKCWCPLKSSSNTNPVDPAMMTAVVSIIRSLGEDPLREELTGTPARFVTWLMNFKKCNLEMKLNGGLVLDGTISHGEVHICSELNLSFLSQCEHHLLPFYGVVHIGYLSSKGVDPIGRSVLHSIVHFYGFKLQVQERLTKQVAETVSSLLGKDVMVVVEAGHTCMISRGIEKFGSNTATFAVLGQFSSNPALRTKFLQSIPSFCKTEG